MFTGIIQTIGIIDEYEQQEDGVRLSLLMDDAVDIMGSPRYALGESVALNGVCLTVVERGDFGLRFDLSKETLEKTTAKFWKQGTNVNIEAALRMGDSLGGHWVLGHVDETAHVDDYREAGLSYSLSIKLDAKWMKFVAPKGSICIDGTSLTVNKVCDETLRIFLNIIPHTHEHTIFSGYQKGTRVNIEIDALARYAVRHEEAKNIFD